MKQEIKVFDSISFIYFHIKNYFYILNINYFSYNFMCKYNLYICTIINNIKLIKKFTSITNLISKNADAARAADLI